LTIKGREYPILNLSADTSIALSQDKAKRKPETPHLTWCWGILFKTTSPACRVHAGIIESLILAQGERWRRA